MDSNWIHFDYDSTSIYSSKNQTFNMEDSIISERMKEFNYGDKTLINIQSVLDSENLNLVIPNKIYENKILCHDFLGKLPGSISKNKFNVLSQIEALAFYLINNENKNGNYRIVDIGASVIKVHDLEINNSKFNHINSSELLWDSTKSIKKIFYKKGDSYLGIEDPRKPIEILDEVHNELKEISPKYYQYRINYESEITYEKLIKIADSYSANFKSIIEKVVRIDSRTNVWYVGDLANWKTFMEKVDKTSKNIIKWSNIIKALKPNVKHYYQLRSNVESYLLDEEGKSLVSLFQIGDQVPVSQKNGNLACKDLKKIRIPLVADKPSRIEVRYDANSYSKDLITSSFEQNLLDKRSNSFYKWADVNVGWEIDGCNNLVINFFQNSTLVYTQNIIKLKLS